MLSSDRIRKELAGRPAEASAVVPYGSGIYSAEWTERVYAELLHHATAGLPGGALEQALQVIRPHGAEHAWRPARPYMLPG